MTREESILNAIDGYIYGLPNRVKGYINTFDMSLKADSGKLNTLRLINQFYEVVSELKGIPKGDITKEHIEENIEVSVAAYLYRPIQSNRKSIGLRKPTEKDIQKRKTTIEKYFKFLGVEYPQGVN